MAEKDWETKIGEMMCALEWYTNNDGSRPKKILKGMATKWFEAHMNDEMAQGIDEFDSIRNLWQKMGCPES